MNWELSPWVNLSNPRIPFDDAMRQQTTAAEICRRLNDQFGVILGDEVGMGKTFVALAVAASAIHGSRQRKQVVIMVPPAVREKWPRDWSVFRENCLRGGPEIRASATSVRSGADFLKLLDDPAHRRIHLIFVTHGALSSSLTDPFIQLAIVRRAFARRTTLAAQKRAFARWAPRLLRNTAFRPERVENLLTTRPEAWRRVWSRVAAEELDDDPVPQSVIDVLDELHLDELRACLAGLPRRTGPQLERRLKAVRRELKQTLDVVWHDALRHTKASIPLLILDEAHHVKNENSLAGLFASRDAMEDADALRGPLADVFDRMLFLTATPFQLGHRELLNVLRRFEGVRSTAADKQSFRQAIAELGQHLDQAQASALRLDRTWGRLTPEDVQSLDQLWTSGSEASTDISDGARTALVQVRVAKAALDLAAHRMRPWIIRHVKRKVRSYRAGAQILSGAQHDGLRGLEVTGDNILPFLLAARAQSYVALAGLTGHRATRAWFADGLASSFEAYLETRTRHAEQDDIELPEYDGVELPPQLSWYFDRIRVSLPTSDVGRWVDHPKVSATTNRVVELWKQGEKVLVFCFYRATGRALRAHISRALLSEIAQRGAAILDVDPSDPMAVIEQVERRAESLLRADAPGAAAVRERMMQLAEQHGFGAEDTEMLVDVATRFMRTPSFLIRYVDLNVRDTHAAIAEAFDRDDGSGATLAGRLAAFAGLVGRLTPVEREGLWDALTTIQTGTISTMSPDQLDEAQHDPSRRTLPNVRLANGEVRAETRQRLMLTFNSPFFPEVLIASSVMSEGVDLHLDCRHVIHHDLDWNPSTLEQRTGRVDRLGSKASRLNKPIVIFEPFVAGTQDEKQYRVVKDREAWFNVIMGGRPETNEAATDRLAARVPMSPEVQAALTVDLSVA